MKKRILIALFVVCFSTAGASAQFGGIVYDPTNYANALLRYQQLVQQLAQLRQTYQQILNSIQPGAEAMSQNLRNMPERYHARFSAWRNGQALDVYGNTGAWITDRSTLEQSMVGINRPRLH